MATLPERVDVNIAKRFATMRASRGCFASMHLQGLAGEDQANALLGMADWLQAEGFYPQAAETYSKVNA